MVKYAFLAYNTELYQGWSKKRMLSSTMTHLQNAMQNKTYQIGHVLPVLSNSKLLISNRHRALLQELQQLSGLPEAHFKMLYRGAINLYAEFVQLIPEDPQNPLGGLLNLGLARATLALRQYRQDSAISNVDPLLNYAIFSAGLFFDVAKAVSQQRVVLCDEKGNYLRDWRPALGTLLDQGGEFYKMYPFYSSLYQALNHESAALFAKPLMQAGFLWISSDLELFIDWLDALRGEMAVGGRRITRVLALIRQDDLLNMIKSLQQISFNEVHLEQTTEVDQFYLWLKEGLEKGTIGINTSDAQVHWLGEDTLFLSHEIFKRFIEESRKNGDVDKLIRAFSDEFAIASQGPTERSLHISSFLAQNWEQKMQNLRSGGVLALSAMFLMDYNGIPMSPLQRDIKLGLRHSRELPSANIKQVINVERNQDPSFKMR